MRDHPQSGVLPNENPTEGSALLLHDDEFDGLSTARLCLPLGLIYWCLVAVVIIGSL